jgi:GT2 family glycosyltransferase
MIKHPAVRLTPSLPHPAPRPRTDRVVVEGTRLSLSGRRYRVQGVTYGPFAPDERGDQFPGRKRAADDFRQMAAAGINTIRTYHVPPSWLLDLAGECGIRVFIDVPWRKHLCFLDSPVARREARAAVQQAAAVARRHPSVMALSIGNEISPDIVRWYGSRRVERFIRELAGVAKEGDPDGLLTYASFPPTEYLDLSFLDFVTFNVYLHDREAFRRYLFRLQNLAGDKPLVLGELGMDTLRHGEIEQAGFLAGHVAEARLMGLAGAFVFSWTDDWHAGGHPIEDWAFGLTHRDRSPKAAYHALREVYETPLPDLLPRAPRVSVVVCTYNGGRTLDQCLRSLAALNYPDCQVIVVDDGSTDDTRAILARHPFALAIHQPNRGLSVARNVGLVAATGEIVAYTDSDCYADPDWLTHLVYQIERSGAAAVGGPNLTPPDGCLAACVAASPGQPTHVLESDQVAEHIPGCNMAFRRDALLAINGFDPVYRKAGDDVDVCWRLQQAGEWITFAPGAFVWHHRRQGPKSYLRQQSGYGEAESLLLFKHPDKFNSRGEGKWRGVLYGAFLQGVRSDRPIIYRGVFGRGLFQCIYRAGPAHWAMLPSTLEWHAAALLIALCGFVWPAGWVIGAVMLGLSLLIAAVQATQATIPAQFHRPYSRLIVGALCYAQPLYRSWARYRTRLFSPSRPRPMAAIRRDGRPVEPGGWSEVAYWDEAGRDRVDLLKVVVNRLDEDRWCKVLDSGWCDWDLEVYSHPWVAVQVCTTQEDHGGGRKLFRVRARRRLRGHAKLLAAAGVLVGIPFMTIHPAVELGVMALVSAGLAVAWWDARRVVRGVMATVDAAARTFNVLRCEPAAEEKAVPQAIRAAPTRDPIVRASESVRAAVRAVADPTG